MFPPIRGKLDPCRQTAGTDKEAESEMMKEEELLQYVHKGADMGCEGILSVLDYAEGEQLRRVLTEQAEGYRALRAEAARALREHGTEPRGISTAAKVSTEALSVGKLLMNRSDSRIAEMTIQGHNMGVSKTLQHLHDYQGDGPAKELAQRLLSAEEAGAEELKAFL